MRTLFPEIRPNREWTLERDQPHRVYVEESGNPDGMAVLFVHGGPGGGCAPVHRRFFDPTRYRIILFDQRGCGRSTPHACLENNTTWHLVDDMEAIRTTLGIDQWLLFGGSWGSALSLAYAQSHPDRVLGMILRGIFLCRRHEIDWFYRAGTSRLFPDYWEDFLAPLPADERSDPVAGYHRLLGSDNDLTRMTAARAWSLWEARCSHLQANQGTLAHFETAHAALAMASIENHYFVNDSFFTDDQLLGNMDRIADIAGTIVHGRYDVICPLENAWQLHRAWPASDLQIIPGAGHAATEPAIIDALIKATSAFASEQAAD